MAKYLVRMKGKPDGVAHLWDGVDTYCHMWTTGGITKEKKYEIRPTAEGRRICSMCRAVEIAS